MRESRGAVRDSTAYKRKQVIFVAAQTKLSAHPSCPRAKAEQPQSIKEAVYFLMDWEVEFRDRNEAFNKENLWRLTHRVSAMVRHPVNPETVARVRRNYWRKVV